MCPNNFIALDTETTGLDFKTDRIAGVSWYYEGMPNIVAHPGVAGSPNCYTQEVELITSVLEDPYAEKIFHNAVFDLSFLQKAGYKFSGRIHDTMIMAHLLDPDRPHLGLKDLSQEIFGSDSIKTYKLLSEWLNDNQLSKEDIYKAPKELLAEYAKEDTKNTYNLFKHFCQKFKELNKWLGDRGFTKTPWNYYLEECCPIISVIVNMQLHGTKLDMEGLVTVQEELLKKLQALPEELKKETKEYIKQAEESLYQRRINYRKLKNKTGQLKKLPPRVEFNWSSNDHLKVLFFEVLKETASKKTFKGNISVDDEVLNQFVAKYAWSRKILELREVRKLAKTYIENLLSYQKGGYIYPKFNLTGTATGRFSSDSPNFQNLPKEGGIKDLFVPREGNCFIYADYDQLEMRLAAHLSQDELLIKDFKNGKDVHQTTADILGIHRSLAKTLNFAIIYNAGGWRIKSILGLETPEEGDGVKKELFSKYTGLKQYLDKQNSLMLQYGMSISEFGRIRRLHGLKSTDRREYNHALKAGFNMPIQSMGASLCKRAMVALANKHYAIANQVHDSLLIEVYGVDREDHLSEIKSIMENIYSLRVPLVVNTKILDSFEEK